MFPDINLGQPELMKADIGKSTGPRSSTSENSGGPKKTLIAPVLLSGKKFLQGAPLWGLLCWKNYIRSCKSFGGPVKLGFSMWLPVLRSGKGRKVFPMSVKATWQPRAVASSLPSYAVRGRPCLPLCPPHPSQLEGAAAHDLLQQTNLGKDDK